MITSTSPGKLYIAGEYAVVEKGYPAIIIAIDKLIKVTIKKVEGQGSIQAYDNSPIRFLRKEDKLILDYRDNRLSYVINSIKVVEDLAKEKNKSLKLFDLSIESDLESLDGKKYGLGSSAAVTVSTIKVLCKLYNLKVNDLELFKLSALVHQRINSNGSGGDLAASIYGGFIAYKSYDKVWLKKMSQELSIEKLIKISWPYLEIKQLKPMDNLNLLIGWTGKPASTTLLVDKVSLSRKLNDKYYLEFLEKSKNCVNKMTEAFENSDLNEIQKQVNINYTLLKELGEKLEIAVITPKLSKLVEIAQDYNGAAKSSGAGGGDCGLAIFDNQDQDEIIINKWRQAEIEYLPLKVYKPEDNDEK